MDDMTIAGIGAVLCFGIVATGLLIAFRELADDMLERGMFSPDEDGGDDDDDPWS